MHRLVIIRRSFRLWAAVSFVSIVFATRPPVLFAQSGEEVEKADEILSNAMRAIGGPEKILSLENFRIKTEGVLYHPESDREIRLNVTETVAFPNRTKQVFDIPQGQRIQVLNGEESWMKIGDTIGELTEIQIREMQRGLFRDTIGILKRWSDGDLTLQYLGLETLGGKSNHVIQVKDTTGEFVNLYIDAETFRVNKKSYRGASEVGLAALEESYSDFRKVSGIFVPFHTLVMAKGKKFIESTVVEVEFNLQLSEDFFFPKD